MSATEKVPPGISELVRQFKKGYSVEHTGGGHYRVIDPDGRRVVLNGKNITLTGTAHGGRAMNNMQAQLKSAGVLKDSRKVTTERKTPAQIAGERKRIETLRQTTSQRAKNRQQVADELFDRLVPLINRVGGIEQPGMQADLAHIAAYVARTRNGGGTKHITPDIASGSIYRVFRKQWVIPEYQELWRAVADEIEAGDDITEQFFALVRESRGLPSEVYVDVKKPVKGDWPFRVELIPIEAFMVDHDYQRPVPWPFVRKIAALFDESLVGTIDVSERRHGALYAVLDGQLRFEACKLVGKTSIWASIYSGLDKQSEARFFLHKNRDKKAIHPFFVWRARIAAGDEQALAIERIVKSCGYFVSLTSAASRAGENAISAIAAIEEAYTREDEDGNESLTPTLQTLRKATLGLAQGQNHILIRGVALLFQKWGSQVDHDHLASVMVKKEPELYLARARQDARGTSSTANYALARLLVADYNRGLKHADKLLGDL